MSLNNAHISLIRQAFTTIGATLPKGVTQALADRDTLTAATVPAATHDQIADAIAECVLAGRDPLDDEDVRRLAVSRALAGGHLHDFSHLLKASAERRVINALAANADEILARLAAPADKAGDTLADARRILGRVELSESEAILKKGPDAARAWGEAREAVHLLRVIDSAWVAMANLTGFASPTADPTIRIADVDMEIFEKVGRKAEPWAIVQAGGTIKLADATTIRERRDRIAAEKQRRQTLAASAASDAWSNSLKMGKRVSA